MAKKRASFGKSEGFTYAVKLDCVASNDFQKQPFGRRLDDLRKVREFMKTANAKVAYVGAKGKATLAAVKEWVKEYKPSQFYACWKSDSECYKDDSVQVTYLD